MKKSIDAYVKAIAHDNMREIREAFDLVEKLSEIEQALVRMGREMRYETLVTEKFHAYAKEHGLVGRQYEVAYNEWMKKADLEDLMIKID